MIYDQATSEFVLASGKRFYANGGILGLDPLDADSLVSEGYDGDVELAQGGPGFTADERREIADAMIAAWERWRDTERG